MHCPSCHERMHDEAFHGQTIDRCGTCDGIWFDESELGPVVRRLVAPASGGAAPRPCSSGELACPKCDGPMRPFNYAYDSGVFLHKCEPCGGVWLESGQLELLAQYRTGTPAVQALENALGDEMRRSNRWQFARTVLRSRLLSGIVAGGYLLIVLFATENREFLARLIRFLVLPMFCIWFPDTMGQLKGISMGIGRPMITETTPGDFVAFVGWILLLCPVVVALVLFT